MVGGTGPMKEFDYAQWMSAAIRSSRRRVDAPDLLQEALLAAVRAGRTDFSNSSTRRWFAGVIRKLAAMQARSEGRRRRREILRGNVSNENDLQADNSAGEAFVRSLTPATRGVALLILAGMNREEIAAALRLSPTAFRQRLTAIRRAWNAWPKDIESSSRPPARSSITSNVGLIRKALIGAIRHRDGTIGAHDPDGHLLVFESSSQFSAHNGAAHGNGA
jgi:DNA-directed RNA polymerase specialized sigma24 family protein